MRIRYVYDKIGFSPGYTIPYSCPELFLNLKTFTHLSDVYSLGVIFYEMLYSRTPFELSTNTDLIERDM
jgi:serine/threonine protein kinase